MNMMKKMNAINIVRYINNEVGMDVARVDDNNNVIIHTNHDFLGNTIYFRDYLFYWDSIYFYINQHGFNNGNPVFGTNSYTLPNDPYLGYKCFNPDGMHGHDCEFNDDTGIRKFDEEILKTAVEGLKKALKVTKSSKFTISNEVEFMDI
jgi:hypothetical protein